MVHLVQLEAWLVGVRRKAVCLPGGLRDFVVPPGTLRSSNLVHRSPTLFDIHGCGHSRLIHDQCPGLQLRKLLAFFSFTLSGIPAMGFATKIVAQIHLRSRKEAVTALCLLYYLPYKIILTFVNIASCYYSIYKYAKYFAKRHPKVVEDEAAVGIVLKLEEEAESRPGSSEKSRPPIGKRESSNVRSRKITVTAMGTPGAVLEEPQPDLSGTGIGVYDFASQPRPANSAAPSVIETIITDLQSSRSLNSRWSSVSGPSGFGTDTGKRISSTYD